MLLSPCCPSGRDADVRLGTNFKSPAFSSAHWYAIYGSSQEIPPGPAKLFTRISGPAISATVFPAAVTRALAPPAKPSVIPLFQKQRAAAPRIPAAARHLPCFIFFIFYSPSGLSPVFELKQFFQPLPRSPPFSPEQIPEIQVWFWPVP